MIKLSQINKRYPNGHEALKDVSFEIAAGEMVFLAGRSGAGKSTLFKLITRIEKQTSGSLLVDQQNVSRMRSGKIPALRRDIGVIFQDHKLLMDRTVFDNVALPLIVIGMPHDEIRKRVRAALSKVGLDGKETQKPITLSGGEQQRVGIARAVINRPNILLADEPTGNLDEALSDEIIDIFADFNRVGVTVLIATHDLRQVERLSKRTLHLEHGELIGDYHHAPKAKSASSIVTGSGVFDG
ncbi:MAG: cell division ATP-binding protein FtsE [Gammaproteobacteria bacterium]|nr:cell division ATP-binding protein FtsE [Gammaproteobacteria bacterium]